MATGQKVTIITDHAAVRVILGAPNLLDKACQMVEQECLQDIKTSQELQIL